MDSKRNLKTLFSQKNLVRMGIVILIFGLGFLTGFHTGESHHIIVQPELDTNEALDSVAEQLPEGSRIIAKFTDDRHALYYLNSGHLMKFDEVTGGKRKLSKRKDPELSLDYYRRDGYHPYCMKVYLLTLLNSNFEEWRIANPEADIDQFKFTTEKMSNSGALFDLDKLNDVSKDVLLRIPAEELAQFLKNWSDEFAPEYGFMFEDMDYLTQILNIGRGDKKPRKDLIYARQIVSFISYFFDESFKIEDKYPEEAAEDADEILREYLSTYDHSDDQSQWFEKIREIASSCGYAAKPKDSKKNPDDCKGHVGHVSTVIRIALMGRAQSPDVWTIQQIMGEKKVRQRIEQALTDR